VIYLDANNEIMRGKEGHGVVLCFYTERQASERLNTANGALVRSGLRHRGRGQIIGLPQATVGTTCLIA